MMLAEIVGRIIIVVLVLYLTGKHFEIAGIAFPEIIGSTVGLLLLLWCMLPLVKLPHITKSK